MLETVALRPADPLLGMFRLHTADPRPDKVDLGVGVYRDETGATPVLHAVKEAERRIWETQHSKSYQGMEGDREFLASFGRFMFGDAIVGMAGVQTIGGTGALRLACDLLHEAGARQIAVGLPTWPNHQSIIAAGQLPLIAYPHVDRGTGLVDFGSVRAAIEKLGSGDAMLLHGCCHNPTGAALSAAQWAGLAALLRERGVVPLIDLAYAGFGRGMEADLAGTRAVIAAVPEAVVAVSCSKNFALYRDRIGALFVKTRTDRREAVQSALETLARVSYSMPAAHGAAVVATILADDALRGEWLAELEGMRRRIVSLRISLAASLVAAWPGADAIVHGEGMFSTLPISPADVRFLRTAHGIYMAESGRMNVAGLAEAAVERVAAALGQAVTLGQEAA